MGYRQSREGEAETLPPPLSPACQSDTSFPCEVGPCEVGNPLAPSRGAGSVWRLARIQCTGKDRIFDEGPLNTVVDAIPCLPRVAENLSRWITPASPPRLPMESRATVPWTEPVSRLGRRLTRRPSFPRAAFAAVQSPAGIDLFIVSVTIDYSHGALRQRGSRFGTGAHRRRR